MLTTASPFSSACRSTRSIGCRCKSSCDEIGTDEERDYDGYICHKDT